VQKVVSFKIENQSIMVIKVINELKNYFLIKTIYR